MRAVPASEASAGDVADAASATKPAAVDVGGADGAGPAMAPAVDEAGRGGGVATAGGSEEVCAWPVSGRVGSKWTDAVVRGACVEWRRAKKVTTCRSVTDSAQTFAEVPEHLALDTPRLLQTSAGGVQADPDFPAVYHECRRPIYFNGVPYRCTAIICHTPGHFMAFNPRGRLFLVVDDGHPVRILRNTELPDLFRGTARPGCQQ